MASEKNLDKTMAVDAKDVPAPTKRRRHLYDAKTKISAIFSVIFAGIALASDGYNAGIVGNMNLLFADLFPSALTPTIKTRISNSFFIGEIVGMLFFGSIIDRIGRKKRRRTDHLNAHPRHHPQRCSAWRDPDWPSLDVAPDQMLSGAGGEYPVCGTAAIEAADETERVRKWRGLLIASVGDLAIDFGFVLSGLVPLIVMAAYGFHLNTVSTHGYAGIWRICFALGLVPPLCVFYFRIKMLNSTAFRNHSMKGRQITFRVLILAAKRYWRRLIGTCACWFLYDFCSYPFGLFSSTIISQLNPNNTVMRNIALGTLINAFYLPGCVVGGLIIDKLGRRNTQALGFAVQGILGMILGGALGPIQNNLAAFVVMYGLFLAAAEAGPGIATILIAGEVFPTAIRGHLIGFSAAWGKAGAAIGTQVFTPIQEAFPSTFKGQQAVFTIGSAVSLVGAVVTMVTIPANSINLEEEDESWRDYLKRNGVDISEMGEPLEDSASEDIKEDVKEEVE
ncbi:Major facilitator superfamily domain-containing protein [Mycena sanguinolenta]|uniref:Major facilitator superfamily domain-containing protein n=1 Tax=Mycena sanguinolenta TaxID=230812 RepID=A0A8H6YSY5_9AGAR|nr:Major facilitator superfamily domain-containing protein [Mycena sanguinolenta]